MTGSPSPDTVRTWFRVIAFAEACSWLGLLIGMYVKYVPETTEVGVKIFGPIHGGIFVAYVLACFAARRAFGWSCATTFWALACSIPPFLTALFEVLADRRGLLGVARGRGSERQLEDEVVLPVVADPEALGADAGKA